MPGSYPSSEFHPARKCSAAGFLRHCGWFLLPAMLVTVSCDKSRDESADSPQATRPDRSRDADGRDGPMAVDPRTALLEAAAMDSGTVRHEAIAALAWRAMSDDPELAREALDLLPPEATDQRIPLVRHLAMQMAGHDVESALAWADTLGSERETAVARSRIALVVADSDPRQAATMLAETGEAGRELDVAIVQVLQHWTLRDPAEAADWLAMFPAGNFRKAGMQTVISKWLAADARAAMGWIATLDDVGDLHGEALATTAGLLARQPPETREAWLEAADAETRTAVEQLTPQ